MSWYLETGFHPQREVPTRTRQEPSRDFGEVEQERHQGRTMESEDHLRTKVLMAGEKKMLLKTWNSEIEKNS